MKDARYVAVVAVFTSLVVGSDLALAAVPNVKLVDALVFVSAYLFGLRVGATVGVLSEFIWSYISPWGQAGLIAPFLILGEVIYALAGYAAARLWSDRLAIPSGKSLFLGGLLAICAFVWDLETNLGTALVSFWPGVTLGIVGETELFGIPFMLSHELSDFLFGMLLVPAVALLALRVRWLQSLVTSPQTTEGRA